MFRIYYAVNGWYFPVLTYRYRITLFLYTGKQLKSNYIRAQVKNTKLYFKLVFRTHSSM
jgi:hypothetical protein